MLYALTQIMLGHTRFLRESPPSGGRSDSADLGGAPD